MRRVSTSKCNWLRDVEEGGQYDARPVRRMNNSLIQSAMKSMYIVRPSFVRLFDLME